MKKYFGGTGNQTSYTHQNFKTGDVARMAEGCDVVTKSCQIYWHGLDLYHDSCPIMDIGATIIRLVTNVIACSDGRLIQVHDGYQRHGGSRRSSPTSSSGCRHGGSRGSSPRGSSPTSSASSTHSSRRPACLPISFSSGNATRPECGECAAPGGAPPLARERRNAQCHVNCATATSV